MAVNDNVGLQSGMETRSPPKVKGKIRFRTVAKSVGNEARTPTMSNCAKQKSSHALTTLGTKEGSPYHTVEANITNNISSEALSSPEARFSSATTPPIIMERPFPRDLQLPVGISPRRSPHHHVSKKGRSHFSRTERQPKGNGDENEELDELVCSLLRNLRLDNNSVSIEQSGLTMLLWQTLPWWLACDLVKTKVPFHLLRNSFLRIQQRSGQLESMLEARSGRNGSTVPSIDLSTRRDRTPHASAFKPVSVRGIPNLGQTCFLNSVLQCLASLEPFLVYLDRINQVGEDICRGAWQTSKDQAISNPTGRGSSFAQELLFTLQLINGVNSDSEQSSLSFPKHRQRRTVDPISVLQRIGVSNEQFSPKCHLGEQQDAQEFLQALLGVIISEAKLDSVSGSSDHMRISDGNSHTIYATLSDDESLTAATVGSLNNNNWEFPTKADQIVDLGVNLSVQSDHVRPEAESADNALSLSALLERIDKGQRELRLELNQPIVTQPFDATDVSLSSSQSTPNLDDTSDSKSHSSLSYPTEEKKQEDFELSSSVPSTGGLHLRKESLSAAKDSNNDEMPESSLQESTSVKMVKTTTSSITPSPLSGWLGSTLQCCKCKHVRPIQNSLFLTLPLVPTSVPAYLSAMYTNKNTAGPNRSPTPACTLVQCLTDFTSVERVEDVECRFCTIHREIEDLRMEEDILRGAVNHLNSKGNRAHEKTKTLQQELLSVQRRLVNLESMDPDDEDSSFLESKGYNDLFGSGESKRLERCYARKCLFLTRCPSVLCCHIQRRYYDPFTNRMEKCVQFVQFDEILDLSPFCAYSPRASASWAAGSEMTGSEDTTKIAQVSQKMRYRLQSVIEHRGNAHGGHYVAYRRVGTTWFRISDNTVSAVSFGHVRTCQAYMLFYEAI